MSKNHRISEVDTWYSRIPAADRQTVDAVAKWLAPVPWQHFVTITFPWNVGASTADDYFRRWINDMEKSLRFNICFLAGKERKPFSYGVEVPWHFHVVMAAHGPIPHSLVEDTWKKLAGKGNRTLTHPSGDSVDVRSFDREKMGIEYCLKCMNGCNGDWVFRWLEQFNPNISYSGPSNHRKDRQKKRFQRQASSAAAQGPYRSVVSGSGIYLP